MSINRGQMIVFLVATALFAAFGAHGAEAAANKLSRLRLMLPVACTQGQDCWIVNQVDMDPEEGKARDYTCGVQTYDGHEGTDFGLRDARAMEEGVSVLAAAPGKVLRVRDTMEDFQPTPEQLEKMIAGKQSCGNGVLIDHGNGWQSISCQLKKGSVSVRPGDNVTAGQKIAEIGQSGAAEFPHLHFGLFYKGPQKDSIHRAVDPFSGAFADQGCGKVRDAMWDLGLSLQYDPMSVFVSGFSPAVPDFAKIRADATSPESTGGKIDALTYWVGLYGMQKGDKITLEILSPDGSVWATQSITQETARARQYYFVGRKVSGTLPAGVYKGIARIERPIEGSATETLKRVAEKTITVTP